MNDELKNKRLANIDAQRDYEHAIARAVSLSVHVAYRLYEARGISLGQEDLRELREAVREYINHENQRYQARGISLGQEDLR